MTKDNNFSGNLPVYALLAIVGIVAIFGMFFLSSGASSSRVAMTPSVSVSEDAGNLVGNAKMELETSSNAADVFLKLDSTSRQSRFLVCSYTGIVDGYSVLVVKYIPLPAFCPEGVHYHGIILHKSDEQIFSVTDPVDYLGDQGSAGDFAAGAPGVGLESSDAGYVDCPEGTVPAVDINGNSYCQDASWQANQPGLVG